MMRDIKRRKMVIILLIFLGVVIITYCFSTHHSFSPSPLSSDVSIISRDNDTLNETLDIDSCIYLLRERFNVSLLELCGNCTLNDAQFSSYLSSCNLTFSCEESGKYITHVYISYLGGGEREGKVIILTTRSSSPIGKRIIIYNNSTSLKDYIYLVNSSPLLSNYSYVTDFRIHYEM